MNEYGFAVDAFEASENVEEQLNLLNQEAELGEFYKLSQNKEGAPLIIKFMRAPNAFNLQKIKELNVDQL